MSFIYVMAKLFFIVSVIIPVFILIW